MFSQLLNVSIEVASRYKRTFAVLFIDLDRFKVVNDTLGHDAGDQLLRQISARLKSTLRESDVVARMGGDEFVVLLHEVLDAGEAGAVAHKILSAVIERLAIAGQQYRRRPASGSRCIQRTPRRAIPDKNADVAMYFAKEKGRNNFHVYSKDIRP